MASWPVVERMLWVVMGLAACGGQDPSSGPDGGGIGRALTIRLRDNRPRASPSTSNASVVAAQDGEDAWEVLVGDRGVYTMPLRSDRYGVLVLCAGDELSDAHVLYGTVADGLELETSSCSDGMLPPVPVTVDVSGVPEGTNAAVLGASGMQRSTRNASASFTFNLQPGPNELFGMLYGGENEDLQRMMRIAPFMVDGPKHFAIDFTSDTLPVERWPLTVVPAETVTISDTLLTDFGFYSYEKETTTPSYPVMPAALRRPGDLFGVLRSDLQGVYVATPSPGPVTLEIPPLLSGAGFMSDFVTVQPVWTLDPLPPGEIELTGYFRSHARTRSWLVTPSRTWLAGATTLRYSLPDFDALVPGLPVQLGVTAAIALSWEIRVSEVVSGSDGAYVARQRIAADYMEAPMP